MTTANNGNGKPEDEQTKADFANWAINVTGKLCDMLDALPPDRRTILAGFVSASMVEVLRELDFDVKFTVTNKDGTETTY